MLLKITTRSLCGLAVAGLVLANATAYADIAHRYSFNDGTANDSVGLAHGTLLNGATVSGGLVTLTGGSGQAAQHVSLLASGANGINIAGYSALTVELWATHNSNTGNNWSRYFDFGSHNIIDTDPPNMDPGEGTNAGNSIFMTPDRFGDADTSAQSFRISNVNLATIPSQSGFNAEQGTTFNGAEAIAGVEHHVVATFDEATNRMAMYLNGVLLAQNTNATFTMSVLQDDGALAGLTDFALIGAALYGDPGFAGSFNEVRIYNMAANAAEVALSFARGPNGVPIPEPAAAMLLVMGLAGLVVARRRS